MERSPLRKTERTLKVGRESVDRISMELIIAADALARIQDLVDSAKRLTGAINDVKPDAFERGEMENFDEALTGLTNEIAEDAGAAEDDVKELHAKLDAMEELCQWAATQIDVFEPGTENQERVALLRTLGLI